MSVEEKSREYTIFNPLHQQCRDCFEGEYLIHEKAEKYLPGLEGSDKDRNVKDSYDNYKRRALFYNTFSRTVEFFKGLILRKGIEISNKDKFSNSLLKVNDEDLTFDGFTSLVVEEILKVGYGGILVDHDEVPEGIVSIKEAKELDLKAKLKFYPAESIIHTRKNIRLLEEEYNDADEFDDTTVIQIRVLDLDDEGFYRQRIYRESEKDKKWYKFGDDIYPKINNQKMIEIPFYPCSSDKNSSVMSKPPLIDLSDVSIHHYNVYADYRNGVHYTGFPQLYIAGKVPDNKQFRLGSGTAWVLEESNASVKYAEFNGSGLLYPEHLLDRLEMYMSKLGARMLMAEKNRAESAEKANIDSESESATLSVIAKNCSEALTKSLKMYLKWNGITVETVVELNTDYQFSQLDPAILIALMKGVQAGLLTPEVFLYNVKKGELIPDEKTISQLIADIEKWEKKLRRKELIQTNNALSERNSSGLNDPEDLLRDESRNKTDYTV